MSMTQGVETRTSFIFFNRAKSQEENKFNKGFYMKLL